MALAGTDLFAQLLSGRAKTGDDGGKGKVMWLDSVGVKMIQDDEL
jgi:hypothetical protein